MITTSTITHFFHTHVHGQCLTTAKYNLIRTLKIVYIKLYHFWQDLVAYWFVKSIID